LKALKPIHKLLASRFAMGSTPADVANEFGFTADYLYDLKRDPLLAAEIERLSSIGAERFAKKVMEVRAKAADKASLALDKAVEVLLDPECSHGNILKAAHEILTFGGIKPPERTEIDLTTHQANKLTLIDDAHAVADVAESDYTDDDRTLAAFEDDAEFYDLDGDDE
jgi:hypothetical protein